jgi:beta-glucosidase
MLKAKLVPGEWGALAPSTPRTPVQIEAKARDLLARMSLKEKTGQMSGDTPLLRGGLELLFAYNRYPIPAGENPRLGVPGIRFSDGPRGVVVAHATCFPVSMGRGASWDPALEERIGDAIGVEARSLGANFFGGVCINLLRHPAWGRAQETYGEDPCHLGSMGSALVRGVQRHLMACIKHYALNSIENTRFKVNVRVGERALREVYLRHFQRCVEAGAASVMSAYNQVNGEHCGHSRRLLREILKGEWGFEGFVVSDFFYGIYDAGKAALAGLDIEMPLQYHYHRRLQRLVESGQVPEAVIDEAVLRILRQKIRFAQVGEPDRYRRSAVFCAEHRQLAREAARKAIVLLKNAPVNGSPLLPLNPARIRRLAVIGELARMANIGDYGSSRVRPPAVVTPLEGIRAAVFGGAEAGQETQVVYYPGLSALAAAEVAASADAAIVCAGYTHRDEGERVSSTRGGDRRSLRLHPEDEDLIRAITAANPRTAVVMFGGSAIITEGWREQAPAILMAWYPGSEGGHAIADILFGKTNPSGKLPCVFPRDEKQLPPFDSQAVEAEYGLYHGYRLMDRNGEEPAFAFGFGLSYTTYAYRQLEVAPQRIAPTETLAVSVEVTNTGPVAGEEIVQLYVGCEGSRVERPVKELKGFARVALAAGETRRVEIPLPARELAYYDEQDGWAVEPIRYRVMVGPSSRPADLLQAEFDIG